MNIPRYLLPKLERYVKPNKVIVLYGPRQIGKTTLLNKFIKHKSNYLFVSGEDLNVQNYLSSQSIDKLKTFVGSHTLLIIDEAQKIPQIGINLKLLVDHCPGLQIIATGSSSFDLAKQLGEPLTGRKITLRMFPIAQIELNALENPAQTKANLEQRLIYGAYPESILANSETEKKHYLQELTNSYLFRDILELEGIRKSQKLTKLLQLLAFQIGKEVSLPELGRQLGLDKNTVEKYLDLLEKSFVLISLSGFSRNLRKEIAKSCRYYFYDLGVRNALINQFNPLEIRNDVGELWENYLITERLKKQSHDETLINNYFWRTYDQQEIDWVEEYDGKLAGFEFKWQVDKNKTPPHWKTSYPKAKFSIINKDNYLDFIV